MYSVTDTSGAPADGSLLLVFHRDPAIPWAAANASGRTLRMAVDLGAYVLGAGPAYAVVDDASGDTSRYLLPNAAADELIKTLYLRP